MRPSDSLIPYVLSSMHPLMHMSMFFTSLILIGRDQDKFYEITGTCKEGTAAAKFQTDDKYTFMF